MILLNSYMQQIDYKKHIEVNPEIRFGKPVIKSTRISVYDVLQWLAPGLTHDQILEEFPQLTEQDLIACISYQQKNAIMIKSQWRSLKYSGMYLFKTSLAFSGYQLRSL